MFLQLKELTMTLSSVEELAKSMDKKNIVIKEKIINKWNTILDSVYNTIKVESTEQKTDEYYNSKWERIIYKKKDKKGKLQWQVAIESHDSIHRVDTVYKN